MSTSGPPLHDARPSSVTRRRRLPAGMPAVRVTVKRSAAALPHPVRPMNTRIPMADTVRRTGRTVRAGCGNQRVTGDSGASPHGPARRRLRVTSIRLRAVGALCLVVCLGLPAGAQAKPNKKVCADAPAGYASCSSRVVTDAGGQPAATATPAGYGPARHPLGLQPHRQQLHADGRDRRRLRRPQRRVRPRDLPQPLRAEPRARRRTAASARSTSPAARATRGRTPAGRRRSRSTSTWSARPARAATSCSSRPPAARWRTSAPP